MEIILWSVFIWLAVQVPAAILFGRFIRAGSRAHADRRRAPVVRLPIGPRMEAADVRTPAAAGYQRVDGRRMG